MWAGRGVVAAAVSAERGARVRRGARGAGRGERRCGRGGSCGRRRAAATPRLRPRARRMQA